MAGDNRRPEEPICRDANQQEDRDYDRRNEVFHGFPCKVNRSAGWCQITTQRRALPPQGKAGEHDHSVKVFLPLRASLLWTPRGPLLA